jgi:putative heme-binding domain-containing protein
VGTAQVLAAWAGAFSSGPGAVGATGAAALASGRDEFRGVLAAARAVAADAQARPVVRAQAVELLAFDPARETAELLSGLLAAGEAKELQRAAVRALVRPGRAGTLPALLEAGRWNGYTPAVRTLLLDRLVGVPELSGALLDALEAGQVPVGALTPAQRQQLRAARAPELRARAEKLLAAPAGDREQAFARARPALALKPVPAAGRAVFEKACASCHRFNQHGVAVGPDLFDIRHQPKESILYHIILPEAEIAPNFVNYECELKDGRTMSGLLAAESATTLTLRMAQGAEEIVARREIVRLAASRLSLMPQEFEKVLSLQELADLLAYLRGEQ